MAIKPAMFALLLRQPAPQEGASAPACRQGGEGQAPAQNPWRRAHRHRRAATRSRPWRRRPWSGRWRSRSGRPVTHGALRLFLPFELRLRLLDARDMRAQRRNEGRNVLAVSKSGRSGTSLPTPRTSLCRFHTHDCNIQMFLFCSTARPRSQARRIGRLVGRCADAPAACHIGDTAKAVQNHMMMIERRRLILGLAGLVTLPAARPGPFLHPRRHRHRPCLGAAQRVTGEGQAFFPMVNNGTDGGRTGGRPLIRLCTDRTAAEQPL